MENERADDTAGGSPKGKVAANRFFGSLKDALLAAGRDELPGPPANGQPHRQGHAAPAAAPVPAAAPAPAKALSAEEAARLARTSVSGGGDAAPAQATVSDGPPTTRVVRREPDPSTGRPARTVLVRGKQAIERATFERDPVVGFLVVVGGPGLGAYRPIFEGNNTVGRAASNRISLDFGDETISSEAQAYVRYDSNDRSFLFVPNLAKTNVVSVNEKRPTAAVELKAMDVITLGRTQVAFVPFCGSEFDWAEISET